MTWVKGDNLWVRSGREPFGCIFVVRRVIGNAVVRNKIKRRLRHICRDLGPFSGSLVVLPQPSVVSLPFSKLKEELYVLVKRLKVSP